MGAPGRSATPQETRRGLNALPGRAREPQGAQRRSPRRPGTARAAHLASAGPGQQQRPGDHPADPARLVLRTSPAPDPASSSTTADPTSHGSLLRRSPPPPRPGPTPLDAPARLIPEPDPNPSPTENQPNLPIHRSDLRTRKPPRCVRLQPPTARQHHPAPSARPPGCGARASLRSASRRAPPGYG
jgi:hypothetical protein